MSDICARVSFTLRHQVSRLAGIFAVKLFSSFIWSVYNADRGITNISVAISPVENCELEVGKYYFGVREMLAGQGN